MYRRNVSSQHIPFALVSATDGSAIAGATVTAYRSIDGGSQAGVGGTVTSLGNGQYDFAPSQADMNGNVIGFLFTASGAINVHLTVVTTAADPTDATTFGIGNLDAAVSSRSTYAGADTAGTTTLLSRLASALTITGGKVDVNDKTGFSLSSAGIQAIWDALTSALTTVGSIGKRIADNLDAAVSSRSTYAGADTAGTTTLLSRLASALTITGGKVDVNDKTGFSLSSAGIQAIWDALTSALTTVGSIGKRIADNLDATVSSRSTYAGGAVASVTAPVTVNDKTGYALTAAYDPAKTAAQAGDAMSLSAAGADALLDRSDGVESSWTVRQALRVILSAVAGKLSGAATSTVAIRDVGDTKTRISATVDPDGNRSSVTYNKV